MNRYFLDNLNVPLKKILWQICFVFFFIYEVQPIGVPNMLTSRKLVFYIAGFIFLTKYVNKYKLKSFNDKLFKNSSNKLIRLGFVMLLWQTVLTLIHSGGNGQMIWGRTLLFLVLTSFFCTFAYFFFDNLKQFLVSLFYTTIIQGAICISHFFSYAVKSFLYAHFMVDANFGYLSIDRAYGLGAAESLLSINLFLGLIATSILIIGSKNNLIYILGYIEILFAALLVGSTGFTLGLILLFLTIILMLKYSSAYQKTTFFVIASIGIFVLFSLAATFFADIEDFSSFHKLISFKEVGFEQQTTVRVLREQAVAPICLHTLLGTSLYRGTIDGLTTMSDTGYIQSYFGNGLIFTVFFYFVLYKLMLKNVRSIRNRVVFIILGFLFVSIAFTEGKEPYIHHFGNTFVFFTACFLANRPIIQKK